MKNIHIKIGLWIILVLLIVSVLTFRGLTFTPTGFIVDKIYHKEHTSIETSYMYTGKMLMPTTKTVHHKERFIFYVEKQVKNRLKSGKIYVSKSVYYLYDIGDYYYGEDN